MVIFTEQLNIDVGEKRMKENMRGISEANLSASGVFLHKAQAGSPVVNSVVSGDMSLTFEQRERLFLL